MLLLTTRRPPTSTLFPYTTLFRSGHQRRAVTRAVFAAGNSHAEKVQIFLHGSFRRRRDRKSTRLNSSHEWISYAVFCLKKKKQNGVPTTTRVLRPATIMQSAGIDD